MSSFPEINFRTSKNLMDISNRVFFSRNQLQDLKELDGYNYYLTVSSFPEINFRTSKNLMDISNRVFYSRNQLQDLTASVENCQSEVVEVKRDMVAIKHEIDTLQAAKHEIEELRDAVDRLEETHRRRKVRLLEQVGNLCQLLR